MPGVPRRKKGRGCGPSALAEALEALDVAVIGTLDRTGQMTHTLIARSCA